jgi:hypothetical protein
MEGDTAMARNLSAVRENRQQPPPPRDACEKVLTELGAAAQAVGEAAAAGNGTLLSAALEQLDGATRAAGELAEVLRQLAGSELPVGAILDIGVGLGRARASRALHGV